jgi:hypothetical protein
LAEVRRELYTLQAGAMAMMTTAFATRAVRAGLTGAFALLLCALATRAGAFAVNSYPSGDETLYLKWGDNHAGTIGGIVTWSFIPAGTAGDVYCSTACPGVSGSSINVEISPGGGFALQPLTSLEANITAMMDLWSAATGIQFVKIDPDSGVHINDPGAVPNATGQIRIGIFSFSDNSVAAVGYSPPPNGGTGAGDILLNSNAYYQFAPGNQGDSYDTTYAPNDFDGLILHELGHAIGFEHPAYDGTCPVMQVDPACLGKINRQLGPDDIAGSRFLYDTLFANGFE